MMKNNYKVVHGFILSTVKYKESSKILNIFTKEYGLIGVYSNGCLNIKSKNRTISEDFTYGKYVINYRENKLSTLIEGEHIDYLLNIKSDITLISYLGYISYLTKEVLNEEVDNSLYDIFIDAILKLEEGINPRIITNILEIKYLDYIGIGLNLDKCTMCGNTKVVALSLDKGGLLCKDCYDGSNITNINLIKTIKLFKEVNIKNINKINIDINILKEIDNIIYTYYNNYTGIYLKDKTNIYNI